MTSDAIANGIYLQRLTKKQTVVAMLDTLMEYYRATGRYGDDIAVAELSLKYWPNDVSAMLHAHSAYGKIISSGPEPVPRKIAVLGGGFD